MIRKARKEEAEAVYQILLDGKDFMKRNDNPQWDGDYPSFDLVLSALESTYVEEEQGKIRGVISIAKGPESYYKDIEGNYVIHTDRYYVLHRLAVKSECRGQGIAKELLRFASLLAKENRLLSVRADTGKRNKAMQSLLLKEGFIDCGTVKDGDLVLEVFEKPVEEVSSRKLLDEK